MARQRNRKAAASSAEPTPSRQRFADEEADCPLCGRRCPRRMLTRHHLQTRKVDRHDIELICVDCHKAVHALFSNKQVSRELNTVESLLEDEQFQKAVGFIRKQSPTSRNRFRRSKSRGR